MFSHHKSPFRLGNKAFAAKDFDQAIQHYTNAIKIDPNNHVFFSNRSASYASKKQYTEAIADAKQCIKLNPSFIKGYYRLAMAQMEVHDLDGALATCKQGMNVDPGNHQLEKLLKQAKARKSNEKLKADQKPFGSAALPSGGVVDSSLSKELMDLQEQYRKTVKDYQVVQATIAASEKTLKINQITIGELQGIPMEEERKMYRGIGKMFLMEGKDEIFKHLNEENNENVRKIEDLTQKKDYLEKRMTSQRQNILECASGK
jgi:Putative Zn-dependent protease, contains TPR repeats